MFNFYGINYDSLYLGSNGYITFGSPNNFNLNSLQNHFSLPRISFLFSKLKLENDTLVKYEVITDISNILNNKIMIIDIKNLYNLQVKISIQIHLYIKWFILQK